MFNNASSNVTGFDSLGDQEKSIASTSIQTGEIKTVDKDVSGTSCNSVQTQTDLIKSKKSPNVNYDRLASWLKHIYPQIAAQLSDNDESQAFKDYNTQNDNTEQTAKLLHHFNFNLNKSINCDKLPISALSWNCTGNTLAVTCCQEHDIWCNHLPPLTNVQFFTTDRNGKYPEVPNNVQMSTSCITAACYHPVFPDVLAGGNCSGEISVWSSRPTLVKAGHEEAITQISWLNKSLGEVEYVLVSSGLDSYLNLWKWFLDSDDLTITHRFKITSETSSQNTRIEKGILCFSFSTFIPEVFIVGAEGGKILKCSLNGAKPLSDIINGINVCNPVVKQFKGHQGMVNSVQFSPTQEEIFFSCGSDGEIHLYHINQEIPTQIIFSEETLSKLYWVPSEARILVGCSQQGGLKFFSLLNGQMINGPEINKINPLTICTFNTKSDQIIAFGDIEGNVQIWNITWNQIIESSHRDIT